MRETTGEFFAKMGGMMRFFRVLMLLLIPLSSPYAGLLSSASLREGVRNADIAFRGICRSKEESTVSHPKTGKEVPITVYTFVVDEVFKGEPDRPLQEVRQLRIASRQEGWRVGILAPVAPAVFEVGKEYFVALGSPSILGTRSVLGGSEGKILIESDREGKKAVVHPGGVQGMEGKPRLTLQKGEIREELIRPRVIDYGEFSEKVREWIRQK